MKGKQLCAALAVGLAAASANATKFEFTYDSGFGILTGTLSGVLQGDGNTILVDNDPLQAAFTSDYDNGPGPRDYQAVTGRNILSLDGTGMDFGAVSPVNDFSLLTAGGWNFVFTYVLEDPFFGGGSYGDGAFNAVGWDIHAVGAPVPEPENPALMLAGLGVLGASARRRPRVGAAA